METNEHTKTYKQTNRKIEKITNRQTNTQTDN